MKKKAAILVILFIIVLPAVSCSKPPDDRLTAGISTEVLKWTEPQKLAGYEDRDCTGVHDPLSCRTLVIKKGKDTLMITVLDLLLLGNRKSGRLRSKISRRTGIPEKNILIHCIHTHSAPVPWGPGTPGKEIEKTIVDNAVNAFRNMEEVEISAVFSVQNLGVNDRRKKLKIPSRIGLLRFTETDGTVLATLVNMGCHPVVLGPDNTLMSADFVHYLREKIELRTGAPVIYVSADLGDKNPDPAAYYRKGTFADAQRFGENAADRMLDMITHGRVLDVTSISVSEAEPGIPVTHEGFYKKWTFDNTLIRLFHPDHKIRGRVKTTSVSVVSLGNLVIVCSPGESTGAHRQRVADSLNLGDHLYMDLTNDYFGYIITADEWNEKGHEESWDKSAGPEVSSRLVDACGKLIR